MDVVNMRDMGWHGDSTCGEYQKIYESPNGNTDWTNFRIRDPTTPHRHIFDELYLIMRGNGEMRIGDESQAVSPGDRVFIP
jgi:mannose-6-phosphate isomerase-like protein (cupin superfamily)